MWESEETKAAAERLRVAASELTACMVRDAETVRHHHLPVPDHVVWVLPETSPISYYVHLAFGPHQDAQFVTVEYADGVTARYRIRRDGGDAVTGK